MSVYHTVEDVQNELKNIKFPQALQAGTQQPMLYATVQGYCDQTEADVNGIISRKYILPITLALHPNSFNILKKICIQLSAKRVDRILRNAGVDENEKDAKKDSGFESEAKTATNEIMNNEKLLYDAGRVADIGSATGNTDADSRTRSFQPSQEPWW